MGIILWSVKTTLSLTPVIEGESCFGEGANLLESPVNPSPSTLPQQVDRMVRAWLMAKATSLRIAPADWHFTPKSTILRSLCPQCWEVPIRFLKEAPGKRR
jgi:hypothetical protein